MQAVLYVGHGSRKPEGRRQALAFMRKCGEAVRAPIQEHCFLELAEPDIEAGVQACVEKGATRIAVVPMLLLAAGHAKKDIPEQVRRAAGRRPGVKFSCGSPFGVQESIVEVLMERIREKAGHVTERDSVLLVGRGSSDPAIPADFSRIVALLRKQHPFHSVRAAYLAAARPSFREGLTELKTAAASVSTVFVVPYLLFSGVLMTEMRTTIAAANDRACTEKFVLCDPLGYHPHFQHIVKTRVEESVANEGGGQLESLSFNG